MKSNGGIDAKNIEAFHTYSIVQASSILQTDTDFGLDDLKVESKRLEFGSNELKGEGGISPFKILLRQFSNLLVFVLIGASVLSYVVKDYAEGSVLFIIVILNSAVGFFQDFKAEKTVESLRKLTSPLSDVQRNGTIEHIPTSELVPGDILFLKSGDIIGADCLLIETLGFETDEALLTGESMPVAKFTDTIDNVDQPLAERKNIGFASTIVTKGRAKGIVFSTGMNTELGKIASQLMDMSSAKDKKKTRLQVSLNRMSVYLLIFAIALVILVFGVNKFNIDAEVLIYAISLAIAVIPEGLLAVLTLTMALGVRRLSKEKALVRKLNSLEVLGSITDICSDKTGTLTQSKMVLVKAWIPHEGCYEISGIGFEPVGQVFKPSIDQDFSPSAPLTKFTKSFNLLARISALCNVSDVKKDPESGDWVGIGDPTEIALQVFSMKVGLGKTDLVRGSDGSTWNLISEFPFDSSIKRMSTLYANGSLKLNVFTKGATERVVELCSRILINGEVVEISTNELQSLLDPQIENLAQNGLRVISLAYNEIPVPENLSGHSWDREYIESGLIYVGLVGIYDPPRPESLASVQKCFKAGIKVHMLTGDHPATATSIAKQVGIIPNDEAFMDGSFKDKHGSHMATVGSMVMTASQFDALTVDEVDRMPDLPNVIARCTPETKVNLINALHRRNRIVAMTGDGVNDSPSLKISDVGISMGITGSDVAKQASSIILTDDNFATIVGAIAEGRRLFTNIGKFIRCLIGANIAELVTLVVGLAFIDSSGHTVFPLSPVAILTNNLITATPPAMALGSELAPSDNMDLPPRDTKSGLFTVEVLSDIVIQGLFMGLLSIFSFYLVLDVFGDGNRGYECNKAYSPSCDAVFRARATTFTLLTILLMVFGYSCRDPRRQTCSYEKIKNIRQNAFLFHSFWIVIVITILCVYIPGLNRDVFKHSPITWEWAIVIISILVYLLGDALYKFIKLFIF
ncbi:Calcium-transporting ATPase 3 [Smittium mucronatum]|uniref:P-type Na(+) transporter n=1 Tax=Smittium mucronatum TaxID=133383 RepID=A0A1R0GX14_9FUNG|nr:Calcium-transporting ATPase 3 [Smittium mucronatum]